MFQLSSPQMRKLLRKTKLSASMTLLMGFSVIAAGPAMAEKKFISIGTGGPTGVYFLAGNAVCWMMNKASNNSENKQGGIKCSAPSTGGSIYNINAIKSGDLDFGVAQSDWQHHAFQGTSKFEGKKFDKIRAVFSLHPEPFQILVAKNSGINSWVDLKGKRVNIGNVGSGQRGTFEVLMQSYGVGKTYFGQATELTSTEQSGALCNGNIDAFGYSVGFPNAGVAQAADGCGARIISLSDDPVKALVGANAFYSFTRIPRGTYSTLDKDVLTFGVRATLVTSADQPDDVVYTLVKSVFDKFELFAKRHPAFKTLTPKSMIKDGLSAPLHPGAVKYYKERGWM